MPATGLPCGSTLLNIAVDPSGIIGFSRRTEFGTANGVLASDMSFTVSPDQTRFTLQFAPGAFAAGDAFRFGMSVFAPIEGSTQEDPDRFRNMNVTVTMSDGSTVTRAVTANAPQAINRFTGFGLVNATKAVQAVRGH